MVGEAAGDGRALLEEQFRTLQRQVPIIHAIIVSSTLGGIWYGVPDNTHWGLRIAFPAALVAITIWRMAFWLRHKTPTPTAQEILEKFKMSRIWAIGMNTGFGLWAILLLRQADLHHAAFISVFIFISAIYCAYCVASLPAIAILPLCLVSAPITVSLLLSSSRLLIAMGATFAVIIGLVLKLLNVHFDGFVGAVLFRGKVIAERERARRAEVRATAQRIRANEMARTDTLTTLPNRRGFLIELDRAIAEGNALDLGFTVGILDLDGFKAINDTFGHQVGDLLLASVGRRLSELVGQQDMVARFGGDEFAVLLRSIQHLDMARAEELCQALRRPFGLGPVTLRISGSCGLAHYPDQGSTAGQLLQRADTALYHIKRNGRGRVARFSLEMQKHVCHREIEPWRVVMLR